MPRSVRITGVVAVLVAAVAGIFTNYVTTAPPDWLADPVRNWLILGLMVAVSMVVALVLDRAPAAPEPPPVLAPTFKARGEAMTAPPPAGHWARG